MGSIQMTRLGQDCHVREHSLPHIIESSVKSDEVLADVDVCDVKGRKSVRTIECSGDDQALKYDRQIGDS